MNSFFAENLLLGSRFDFEDLEIDIEPNELAELFALESEYEKVSKKLKTNDGIFNDMSSSEGFSTDFASSSEELSEVEIKSEEPSIPPLVKQTFRSPSSFQNPKTSTLPLASSSQPLISQSNIIPEEKKPNTGAPSSATYKVPMNGFNPSIVNDFKHVIYNMLVDNYNDPTKQTFVLPVRFMEEGVLRTGFKFNAAENPDKKIPELYAMHIRKSQLDKEDRSLVFVQDLYKFYYRASIELLSKYFERRDKYTFLDEDVPLFIPGGSIQDAENRLKQIKTRARKKRSRNSKK